METGSNIAGFFQQNSSTINGRGVWHYLISTPIGQINVVQYEQKDKTIKSFLFEGHYDKAEAKYESLCKGILTGKI